MVCRQVVRPRRASNHPQASRRPPWGNDLHGRVGVCRRLPDLCDGSTIRSIRNQDAYRATDKRAFHFAYDLQCGRTLHLQYGRCCLWRVGYMSKSKTRGDPGGEVFFYMSKVTDHRLAYVHMSDLGKLEDQRRRDMRLLIRSLAEVELPRLA